MKKNRPDIVKKGCTEGSLLCFSFFLSLSLQTILLQRDRLAKASRDVFDDFSFFLLHDFSEEFFREYFLHFRIPRATH